MMAQSQKQNDLVEAILNNTAVFEADEDAYQLMNPDDVRVPVFEGNIAQPIMGTDEDQWIKETCLKHGKGTPLGVFSPKRLLLSSCRALRVWG